MSVCKKCNEVYSNSVMTNGYCKNCIISEVISGEIEKCEWCEEEYKITELSDKGYCENCITNKIPEALKSRKQNEIGFQWWEIWAWLGLIFGNSYIWGVSHQVIEVAIIPIVINTILMIFVLKYNKYAFLIATVLSLNPLLWIINAIYLSNRWNHPKVNKNIIALKKCPKCNIEVKNVNDKFCDNCGEKLG